MDLPVGVHLGRSRPGWAPGPRVIRMMTTLWRDGVLSPNEERSRGVQQRCRNCGVHCSGSFCCEWCMLTYAQRSRIYGSETRGKKRTKDSGSR